jgi:hypothetical protein
VSGFRDPTWCSVTGWAPPCSRFSVLRKFHPNPEGFQTVFVPPALQASSWRGFRVDCVSRAESQGFAQGFAPAAFQAAGRPIQIVPPNVSRGTTATFTGLKGPRVTAQGEAPGIRQPHIAPNSLDPGLKGRWFRPAGPTGAVAAGSGLNARGSNVVSPRSRLRYFLCPQSIAEICASASIRACVPLRA